MFQKLKGGLKMSKKVVVISSSPRKGGNSDTMCDGILLRDVRNIEDVF